MYVFFNSHARATLFKSGKFLQCQTNLNIDKPT